MSLDPVVYSFLDPVEFLNFEFRSRQRSDVKFTLRSWALRLGFQNSSYLSNILKRERRLKVDFAGRLADSIGLSGKERSYFELIVLRSNAKSEVERDLYSKLVKKARPKGFSDLEELPLPKFEFVAEWHNWAILELFYLKDFKPTAEYIQEKLGPAVTPRMIKESLAKLTELGFLEPAANGGFRRAHDNPIFMKNIPAWSVDAYNKVMLDRTKAAIERIPYEKRQMRSTMVAMSRAKFEEARKIVEDAHKKILELSADSDGDHVYQLSTGFFPITTDKKELLQ
jgi:uncharacterized protein (TIGR02147 family)